MSNYFKFSTKYETFVSATFRDLEEERKQVEETIFKNNQIPIGMEYFSAEDEEQWNIIKRTIDSSDIYVLVIGHRYGSINKKHPKKVSYTEMEFDYAVQRSKMNKLKILSFIRERDVKIDVAKIEQSEKAQTMLNNFIEKVKNSGIMVDFWKNKEDLANLVSVALSKTIKKFESNTQSQFGWIKKEECFEHLEQLHRLEGFKNVMKDTAKNYRTHNDDNEIYNFDEFGNCQITRKRVQLCMCDVTHSYIEYCSDDNSKGSQIIKIIDQPTGRDLQYLIHEKDNNIFSFFVLFNNVIKKGKTIKYEFTVEVKNYLSNLIEKGEGVCGYEPFKKTTFSSKKDIFTFPDIPKYEKLNITLVHSGKDNQPQINQPVLCNSINNGRKIFIIDHGNLPLGSKITVRFSLK